MMQSLMMMSGNGFYIYLIIVLVVSGLFLIIYNLYQYYEMKPYQKNYIRPKEYPSNQYFYVDKNEFNVFLDSIEAYIMKNDKDYKGVKRVFDTVRNKLKENEENGKYKIKERLYYQLRDLGDACKDIQKKGIGIINISVKQ